MSVLFTNRSLFFARLRCYITDTPALRAMSFDRDSPDWGYLNKKRMSRFKIRERLKKKRLESDSVDVKDYQEEPQRPQEQMSTDFTEAEKLKRDLNSLCIDNTETQVDFPSDLTDTEEKKKLKNDRTRDKDKNRYEISNNNSVLMFPGQGSQFVGMGENLLNYPNVPEMFETASTILKYDLLDICLNGPKSELDKTVHCQPAVVVTSLAALQKLYTDNPEVVDKCQATAGFSVGEITALIFSGVLSFQDGIEIVKCRAEAMQELCLEEPSGMLTVIQNHDTHLKLAMQTAREYCSKRLDIENPVCSVANFLAPNMKVIAGHEPALDLIETNYKDFGILRVKRLPVSGAFHTRLMKPAADKMFKLLENCEIKKPAIPVLSNIYASPYSKSLAKKLLQLQLWSPVKWEHIMNILYVRQGKDTVYPQTYEVGPGKQLGLLLRSTNRPAFTGYQNIEV